MMRSRSSLGRMAAWVAGLFAVGSFATDIARAQAARGPGPARRGALIERWQEATPAERERMRARVRERFEDVSPRERRRFGRALRALERALPELSSIERVVLVRAVAQMPEGERKAFRRRLRRVDDMEPAERKAFLAEIDGLVRDAEGEVERLSRNRDRWQRMSESEREEYRAQMKKLRAMSPEERRRLFDAIEDGASR